MMDIVECSRMLSTVTYPSTVVGDFTLPYIDWNDLSAPSDRIYSTFIEFVNNMGMSQFATAPTRGEHVLDLVLANDAYVMYCWFGFNSSKSKASDHDMASFNLHCGVSSCPTDEQLTYCDFNKVDYTAFNEYLLSVDWQAALVNSYDVNTYWDNFMEVLNTALEMFVPTKCIELQNHKSLQRYSYYIRQIFRKRKAA